MSDVTIRGGMATFSVEVSVPAEQAEELRDAMTGDDDDVFLVAEAAIRELGGLDEVELRVPGAGDVRDSLRNFGQANHSL